MLSVATQRAFRRCNQVSDTGRRSNIPVVEALHTVASTAAQYGGTSRSVTGLCSALADCNVRVRLVSCARVHEDTVTPSTKVEVALVPERGLWGRWLRSPLGFTRVLCQEIQRQRPSLVHDHGAWLPSNYAAASLAHRHDLPFVLSARGMLTPWALEHRARKKQLAWRLYQERVTQRATALHATSEAEADGLRALGLRQPIAVVPNGLNLPQLARRPLSGSRRALFLGRLHPVKGLPILLEAWASVRPPGWTLELAGPDEDGHRRDLEQLVKKYGLSAAVVFSGSASDVQKWQRYASADLFILPSHSESFGMAVVEALASCIPVIATTGAPWAVLRDAGCGWWVPATSEKIASAVAEATTLDPEARQQMGCRGRKLVEERYSWQHAAACVRQLYNWILSGGPAPTFVRA
jgi:glycosyltransferase involved in cell wall biosynthesis